MRQTLRRLRPKLRRLIAKSWILSRCYYPLCGHRLPGRANDEIWYFAYGANMHDNAFRVRRGIQPLEHCSGRSCVADEGPFSRSRTILGAPGKNARDAGACAVSYEHPYTSASPAK